MKTSKSTLFRLLAVSSLLLTTTACPADPDPNADETGSGDDDSGYVCDPVGAIPEVGELLNAPLDDDVEVIQKDPQHPGDPGPDNLPE